MNLLLEKKAILFLLLLITKAINAQEPNDCQFALVVCGNSNLSVDVRGIGTQELSGTNTCGSQENNSIWLQINIETSGTLGFILTPDSNSINEDYDFFIYGPDVACGNIGQAIRCSTTNPAAANQGNNLTGLNSSETDTSEGPGANGNSFVSELNVLAGESYFIIIDRPIGNSPFSIEWTGTATFPENPANPVPTNLLNINICDSDAPFDDNITEIDVTDLTRDIINGQADIAVSYHNTESDANININPLGSIFNNTTSSQTIFIRIENTTTGCFILNDLNINVSSLTNFNEPTPFEICDDNSDGNDQNGISTFHFNIKTQEIINNIASINYSITYHLSQADAEIPTNALPTTYTNINPTPTEIFVRIEDNDSDCIGFSSFNIIVAEKPLANNTILLQCDEDGISEGITIFNLDQATADITGGATDVSIAFYTSQNDAENENNEVNNNAFENDINPQTIYARVTNTNTGCVSISEISLEVSTTTSNNISMQACDDDGVEDGFTSFNLANANTIIPAGAPDGLTLQYYETYPDALVETNPLNNTYTNTIAYNQTIYARVENNNACFGISEIDLTVFQLPNVETEYQTLYCLNDFPKTITLNAGIINDSPSNYFYQWSTGETTDKIEVNTPGTYTVKITNPNGCFKDRTITILPSNIATITNIEIIDASQNNSISIIVSGEGDYQYALNNSDGPYQDSPIFNNLLSGIYTVYVKDKNNCGIVKQLVSVVGFPKFFTPNDDGKHDFWQIYGASTQFQTNTTIYIFDRYGKLLKELNPLGIGWDGTYNGVKLPVNDYWFKVTLEDGRTFTSHFALKR